MVNEMRALLRAAAETPPADDIDLAAVLRGGRQRVRRRRTGLVGGLTAAAVAVVAVAAVTGPGGADRDAAVAGGVPRPDGPVIGLEDAVPARAGVDYDVLAQHTNEDLDRANGQYYDGVTDDGLILFRDGPHGIHNEVRYALLDPATGEKEQLPRLDEQEQLWPVELSAERLALVGERYPGEGVDARPVPQAQVFDRAAGTWRTLTWPGLPVRGDLAGWTGRVGPDGRLYLGLDATEGSPPPGGWPIGPDGEADDAGADGETAELWSVSLSDPADVRDEGLRVGDVAFTDHLMVWTAATNGRNERVHVRDLATGAEHDFDPRSGERCNLLGLGAAGDRIVLSQYCGTYRDGRDDRVQILSADGDPVTTIQGDGIDATVVGDLVEVTSYLAQREGAYVYDLADGRLLRVSDSISSYGLGGPVPAGYLLWHTAYGERTDPLRGGGATQWLARWR